MITNVKAPRKGDLRDVVSRLEMRAENEDEQRLLAWLWQVDLARIYARRPLRPEEG